MSPETQPIRILHPQIDGVEQIPERCDEVLTPEALDFLKRLHVRFSGRRAELLRFRHDRRKRLVNGSLPKFLVETADIRNDPGWRVAPLAPGLEDRRVEITGPTERKMTINALNSGAKVWLADMEDANTPHWENVIGGQVNLYDAIRGSISFDSPEGKHYELKNSKLTDNPTIVMRPRGWHLTEKHIKVGREPMVGALVDFGLYFFHNAKALIDGGRGPYFYLPKLENHHEARLWHDIFAYAEEYLDIERGTIRATVLIETILAAFEMEEILYELREYSSGLNAGRWDYIFSIIKKFRDSGSKWVLPDRHFISMKTPPLRAYAQLVVKTAHKRGASAMGGMAAFIPSRDEAVNARAFEQVTADKEQEARDGFDGAWVAHPGMVDLVYGIFERELNGAPNQLDKQRDDVSVTAADLLNVRSIEGDISEADLRTNISIGLRYLEAWIGGNGAVAIYNLMEDAATAEISRSQVWQWIHNGTLLADGRKITRELAKQITDVEAARIAGEASGDAERHARIIQARDMFEEVALEESFPTFLTLPLYANIVP
ncbi:MAG: malate synthase A [Actinomycetaceae bacterium]|nr:malate synthase A [Actinomycetaceae bacterium]